MPTSIPLQLLSPRTSSMLAAFLVILSLSSAACAGSQKTDQDAQSWSRDFVEAQRLTPEPMEEALLQLAERAPTREQARQARFELGRLALQSGRPDHARERFQALWDEAQDDNIASRALYELGRLAAEADHDREEARRLLRQTIVETPPWAGSEFALDYLLRMERNAGKLNAGTSFGAEDFAAMAAETDDDRMGARLHLEQGLLLLDQNDDDGALAAFRSAFERCSDCAATDDALMKMAEVYARHQRWNPAIEALEIVAARRQPAFFVGTYSSHRTTDARFRLAEIELIFRQNYGAASEHLREFLRHYPHDMRADDAAWHLVQIARLDGTSSDYERALRRFLRDYPHSRLAHQAERQLQEPS